MKELRDFERAQECADALAEYEQSENRIRSLQDLLHARNKEPYDWHQHWGARGPYQRQAFTPPQPGFSYLELSEVVAKQIRITRWALAVGVLAGIGIAFGSMLIKVLGVVVLLGAVGGAYMLHGARREVARALLRTKSDEFARDVELLRKDHELVEAANESDWEQEERQREIVRTAEARDDPGPLAAVLEVELANESLPVPLVVELEMSSVKFVRLELSLPEIDEIPEQRAELTKTGRLSTKKVSQRDRVALYVDVCCSVALLLIYEVFRVLPMVSGVEVFGTAEGVDAATGKPVEFVALHLQTDRRSFEDINLDAVDPSSALDGLGGRIAVNRKGELGPLPGVAGLLST